jgi:hypothetical protein
MASVKTPTPPPAPTPVSMADEYLKTARVMSDPELQKRMLDVERTMRPEYAKLNLADLETYMGGVLGLQEKAARQSGALEREQLAAQRAADIAAIEQYGGRATAALRASDPESARLANLSLQAAEKAFARAERLSPEDLRLSQQAARQAGLARGRVGDQSNVAAEILNREDAMARRRAEAGQYGQLAFGMSKAMAADPLQYILGRSTGALGYGAQQQGFTQQLGAQPIGPRAVDYNAALNMAMQNQANLGRYQTSIYGSQAQAAGASAAARGQLLGSMFGAAGTMLGGPLGGMLGSSVGGMFGGGSNVSRAADPSNPYG